MFEYKKLNDLDIIVYCGGKCGSSTLHYTFKHNGYKTFKVHDNDYFKFLCRNFNKDTDKTIFDVIDFNTKQSKNIYIIDVYRTPIERKISSFFQNISQHVPIYNRLSVQEIIDIFNEKYLYELEDYHSIDEVFNHYGLTPFTDFDFENKYNIVKFENKICIKLRFSDINEWNKILSKIFNKYIVIHNDNLTKHKNIYPLYQEFLKNYKVPENFINDYLINNNNNNEFKIYNTKIEQENYIRKWSENTKK